jgi:hypothetical protein
VINDKKIKKNFSQKFARRFLDIWVGLGIEDPGFRIRDTADKKST